MNNSNGLTSIFWLDNFVIEKMVVPVNDKNVSCSKWWNVSCRNEKI